MFRHLGIVFLLIFALLISTWGQTPISPLRPPQEKNDEEDVVRITTNLVQMDATGTDKDGRPVTDLKREDFEIREEGQLQQITDLPYIGTLLPLHPLNPVRQVTKERLATRLRHCQSVYAPIR